MNVSNAVPGRIQHAVTATTATDQTLDAVANFSLGIFLQNCLDMNTDVTTAVDT